MKKLLAWVKLVRPLNFILFLAGVAAGAILSGGLDALHGENATRVWWTMLSAALIGGAGNAINDYFDYEIDAVNRPDRPIPSGQISRRSAFIFSALLALGGILISIYLSPGHFILASISTVLLFFYSSTLKLKGFLGNLTVAGIIAISLLYGGASTGEMIAAIPGFIFAFLLVLAREIIKDIEDLEGDESYNAQTIPIVHGVRSASIISQSIIWLLIVLSPLPFVFLNYGGWYMALIIVLGLSLISTLILLNSTDLKKETYSMVSHRLKASMIIGIGALVLSKL